MVPHTNIPKCCKSDIAFGSITFEDNLSEETGHTPFNNFSDEITNNRKDLSQIET